MRFSLQFMFALLTISAFVALLYQLKTQTEKLQRDSTELKQQIEAFDPNLELDVKYLRLAAETKPREEPVFEAIEADFNQRVSESRLPDGFKSDNVVARYIDDLDVNAPILVQLFVPENVKAILRIEAYDNFSNELKQKLDPKTLYDFDEPIEFELPTGRSDLEVFNEVNRGKLTHLDFSCNGTPWAELAISYPSMTPREFWPRMNSRWLAPSTAVEQLEGSTMILKTFYLHTSEPDPPEVGVQCILEFVKSVEESGK